MIDLMINREYITVVAMEVLIKYCINSFFKFINSFDGKLISFLYLLLVGDWSIRSEGKSNWLTETG